MVNNSIIELLRRFLSRSTNLKEEKQIEDWYKSADENQVNFSAKEAEYAKREIYKKIKSGMQLPKLIPFYRQPVFRAAAVIAAVLLTATLFLYKINNHPEKNIDKNTFAKIKNDVKPPASNKALLKLADGSVVPLDSISTGTLAVQGSVKIYKTGDGKIAYKGSGESMLAYNTLTVPRGSTPVKLVLADGSNVWLNVASSISYPVAFIGKERRVEIDGEAYFEVAKNASMPFIVKKVNSNTEIKVLGTHFNVKGYNDEELLKVTLLEGSVKVSNNSAAGIIAPGEQAQVKGSAIAVTKNVDLDEVMAWKNGRFYFDGADMRAIMRQVEKWYDVDIQFQSDINASFVAKISRDVNISHLLQIFEMTGLVHFKIDGKTIIIMR